MAIAQDNPIAEYVAKHLGDNLRRVGGTLLVDRLFVFDAWRLTARTVRVTRRVECPLCGGEVIA